MPIAFNFLIPTLPIYLEIILVVSTGYFVLALAAYIIAALLVSPLIGGVAVDRKGRKMIYLISFLLFSLIYSVYVTASTFAIMLAISVVHGFTRDVLTTVNSPVVMDIVPQVHRGEGLGVLNLSMTIAMAVGPIIVMRLTANKGLDS